MLSSFFALVTRFLDSGRMIENSSKNESTVHVVRETDVSLIRGNNSLMTNIGLKRTKGGNLFLFSANKKTKKKTRFRSSACIIAYINLKIHTSLYAILYTTHIQAHTYFLESGKKCLLVYKWHTKIPYLHLVASSHCVSRSLVNQSTVSYG